VINKEIKKDINFLKKHTLQPAWWKIARILILLAALLTIWLIFGILMVVVWFSIVAILALLVHMLHRIKTNTYTKSWMDFRVKEIDGKLTFERIGLLYYSLIFFVFLIATVTVLLLK
jgi:hypothetical protein